MNIFSFWWSIILQFLIPLIYILGAFNKARMHQHVLGDQAQFEPTKGAQPTSYQHTQLEMFCQSGTSKTTGGRHRVDQTDVPGVLFQGYCTGVQGRGILWRLPAYSFLLNNLGKLVPRQSILNFTAIRDNTGLQWWQMELCKTCKVQVDHH